MKKILNWLIKIIVFLAMAIPVNSHSQEAIVINMKLENNFRVETFTTPPEELKIGRVEINPGLQVEGIYDDNVFLEADKSFAGGGREGRSEDFYLATSPILHLLRRPSVGELGAEILYVGRNEKFSDLSEQDFFGHDLKTHFEFKGPGNRTKFTIRGEYLDTVAPPTKEFGTNFNPRSPHIDLKGVGEFSYTPNELFQFSFSARFRDREFKDDFLKNQDRADTNIQWNFFFKLAKHTIMGLQYAFNNVHFTDPNTLSVDSDTDTFLWLIQFDPTSKFVLELNLGYEKRSFGNTTNDRDAFRFQLRTDYFATRHDVVRVVGSRSIATSTFQGAPSVINTKGGVEYQHFWFVDNKKQAKASLRTSVDYSLNEFDDLTPDIASGGVLREREDNNLSLNANFNYSVQDWLKIDLNYNFTKADSNFDDRDYIKNVISTGLVFIY